MTARRTRLFRYAFGLAGLAFVAVAFWTTYDGQRPVFPSWPALALAFAASAVSLAAGALGWVALFEGRSTPRHLAHAFLGAQLGKYIPGGVWQVVGPIGLAVGPDVTLGRATAMLSVQVLVHVVAGATAAAGFGVFGTTAPVWLRGLALAGLLFVPLLYRGWLQRVAALVGRLRRAGGGAPPVPSQRAILTCYAWDLVSLLAAGLGFAVLLRSGTGVDPLLSATFGFSLAWVVGFLALPVPAGIGVREAVLLAALASGTAALLAASVVHRLVTIVAEVTLAAATWRPS